VGKITFEEGGECEIVKYAGGSLPIYTGNQIVSGDNHKHQIGRIQAPDTYYNVIPIEFKRSETSLDKVYVLAGSQYPTSGDIETITTGKHTHTVTISDHTHTISIPNHTHTVEIPAHTHNLAFGIYESGIATAVTVKVDGNACSSGTTAATDEDVTSLITKNSQNMPASGWHSISFTPDQNSRIIATLVGEMYIVGL
jgi:hypothetical protein